MALPPGPTSFPALLLARWFRDPTEVLADCAARYGEIFTLRLPRIPVLVVVSNPDWIKEVFAGDADVMRAGEANTLLRPFLGEHSILQLDGAEHLRQRRLLLPPFHGERMQAYGRQMVTIAQDAIDAWPQGKPFAVHKPMQQVTLSVILRTVFGLDEPGRLATLSRVLTELLESATWAPLLMPAMQVDLGKYSPWGRVVRMIREADQLLYDEMARRRALGTAGRTDVLSMLLDARDEAGQPMTDQELRDELMTLLVAGHETTATSLAWALRWLLDAPAVLRRLRDEVRGAVVDGVLQPERLAKLEYLDATVREALRLVPVIPMVARKLAKPVRLGGYDLPAGVVVAPSIYLAHHREQVFPGAARFDPEHFLRAKPAPTEWLPFGGGVRRCVGMAFAIYEMKMVLGTTLLRTTLRLEPRQRIRVARRAITLTPSTGVRVVLDARSPRLRVGDPPPPARPAGTTLGS